MLPFLDETSIRALVGGRSFERGVHYAREGRVHDLTESPGQLSASVRGSGARSYRTVVTTAPGVAGRPVWSGGCTCPMAFDCKHVAAVMYAALSARSAPDTHRAASDAGRPAAGAADWERPLDRLVQAMSAHAGDEDDVQPLALQLELVRGNPSVPQRFRAARPVGTTADTVQSVRVRPMVWGRSGRWVGTGASWRDLEIGARGSSTSARQRDALLELYHASQARRRDSYSYYASATQAVHLGDFGPQLWTLLQQLVDSGVRLVLGGRDHADVALSEHRAHVALDLRRAGGSDAAADRAETPLTVDAVLSLDGRPLPHEDVCLLGDPVHGLLWLDDEPHATLAPLDRPADPGVVRLLSAGEPLTVPPTGVARFLAVYYPVLRQGLEVTSSDGSVTLPRVEPPRLSLTATFSSGHRLTLDWGFAYTVGDEVVRVPLSWSPREVAARDRRAERALTDGLQLPETVRALLVADVGGVQGVRPRTELTGLDTVAATDELLPALRERPDVLVEVRGSPLDYRHSEAGPLVEISASDSPDADWFDLGVDVSIDGEPVPFQLLFAALVRGETHLVLDSGTWFRIDRPELEQLRHLIEEARGLQDREREGLRISAVHAGWWEELERLGVVRTQSERWTRTVARLLQLDDVAPASLPDGVEATLRPYQLEGFQWLSTLWDLGLGGVLADDMGLGKTLQTLAMMVRAVADGSADGPFLVVAPTSVVGNWAHEAARFAPGLSVVTVTETQTRRGASLTDHVGGAHVVVTSYALFRIEHAAYAEMSWSGLVLDEAQMVKNHRSTTYHCVRTLATGFKLAITGTPMENNLMELWSLTSVVAPGLFPSPQRFTETYVRPIERGGDADRLAALRRRVRPLLLRRTKEQVATDLPPKQEQVLEVALNPRHRRIYQTHLQRERQKVLGLLGDLDKNRFEVLRSITVLRQAALAPALLDEAYAGARSSKIDVLLEQLEDVIGEGHRALVFSQFTGFLRLVRDRLDAEGIAYCYLDGRTRNRGERVREFKEGTAPVFLISLKAGGFGLNLTEADYVFVLDPWWNPAVEAQAVDRTHRIGQDKPVMVYRLVSAETIEEKVMALKSRKSDLFTRVMDDGALLSAPLTADDFRGLLSS